jgi:hypothetical protein
MKDVNVELPKPGEDIDRLGEVLDRIASLTAEANEIKAALKAEAEIIGDRVAFNGAAYTAVVVTRPAKKVDWHGIVLELKVPQKKVDEHTTVSTLQVCTVKKLT